MFATLHRKPCTIRPGRRNSRIPTLSEKDAQRICHCPTILAANGRPVVNPYYIVPDIPPSENPDDFEPELETMERPLSRYNHTSKEYQLTGRRGSDTSSEHQYTTGKSSSTESFIPVVEEADGEEGDDPTTATTSPSRRTNRSRSSTASSRKSTRFSDTITEKEFAMDAAAFQTIPGPSKTPRVLRKIWRAVY
ncbi:hypothetical protein V5O48_013978 [Marasmius crinis-equi]|uniref:Uncharacterized protein n=1 Tax=Marasmius crinis-equi TaxID=585013 RepID=A0ABR3EZ04_9AGAR